MSGLAPRVLFVALAIVSASNLSNLQNLSNLVVESVPSPAVGDSAGPQFTGQGDRVILSWLEMAGTRTTLKFAGRTASGWTAPQTVASGTDFMVNSADVPSVLRLSDGTLAAHWLQENGPDPESYNLLLSWSKDNGRSWSTPVSPHHDGKETQHGFASLYEVPDVGLGLVWLDGRLIDPERPEAGGMSLRAALFGKDGRQRSEAALDTRVCECCPTSAAATSEGIIVAYRNRSADEIRDIYVARRVDGRWTPPSLVYADNWKIEGCPVNGPAVAARGPEIVVAWFSAVNDEGRTWAAFSRNGGRQFGPPIRIDEASSLGRVGVAYLPDGSAAVGWVEFAGETSQFKVRLVDSAGGRSAAITIAPQTGTRFPRVASAGGELLFAWTETVDGSPRMKTARAVLK